MGIERCRQVIQTKHDDIAGRLKNMGGGAYASQNSELNLKYTWLTKRTDTITNVILRTQQNVYYNYKQNHLFSRTTDLTRCDPKSGACITPDVTAIWNKNDIDICRIAKKKTLTTTDIIQYRDTKNDRYHLTIPSLAMSLKNFVQDDEIAKCFGNNINVTTDGFVIEFINCEQENNHTFFAPIKVTPSMQRQNPGGSWERFLKKTESNFAKIISNEMNFISDKISSTIHEIEAFYNKELCMRDNQMTALMTILAKSQPSDILFEIMQKHYHATNSDGVILARTCSEHTCTIRGTLRLSDNSYSFTPLADVVISNRTVQVQYNPTSGKWQMGLTNLQAKPLSGIKSFRVENEILTYNGDKRVPAPSILTVHPQKTPYLNISYVEDDFTITRFFDSAISAYEAQIEKPIKWLLDKASIEDTVYTAAVNARPMSYNIIKYFDNPGFAIFEIIVQSFANLHTILTTIGLIILLYMRCMDGEKREKHLSGQPDQKCYTKGTFHDDEIHACQRRDTLPPTPPIRT